MIYDVTEEEMPYEQSDQFDRWAVDTVPDKTPDFRDREIVDLPKWLTDLRNNNVAPQPCQGAARARRIEAIKTEIAACQITIDDCDRMADDLKTTSCMAPVVLGLMREQLAGIRAREVDRKRWLEAERDAKRGAG